MRVLFDVLQDLRYTGQACDGSTGFLAWRARIQDQQIEGVDLLQFGPDGKIREFTVFFRPLPAAALALRLIGAWPGPPQESRPGRRRLRPDSPP